MSFPEIGLARDREIQISKKGLNEFSRNWSESPLGKVKFLKNIRMSFPEVGNKGLRTPDF